MKGKVVVVRGERYSVGGGRWKFWMFVEEVIVRLGGEDSDNGCATIDVGKPGPSDLFSHLDIPGCSHRAHC